MAGDPILGNAIAEAISAKGWTVPRVARALKHDPSWLYRVIHGEIRIKAFDLEGIEELLDTQIRATGALREVAVAAIPIEVIDQEVSASLRGGVVIDHVYLPEGGPMANQQHIVALKVRGDCLSPEIVDGDYVIVDTSRTAENGNPVVATVDGQLHVKRFRVRANGRTVLASNEGEIPVSPRQIDGVVIGFWRGLGRFASLP